MGQEDDFGASGCMLGRYTSYIGVVPARVFGLHLAVQTALGTNGLARRDGCPKLTVPSNRAPGRHKRFHQPKNALSRMIDGLQPVAQVVPAKEKLHGAKRPPLSVSHLPASRLLKPV